MKGTQDATGDISHLAETVLFRIRWVPENYRSSDMRSQNRLRSACIAILLGLGSAGAPLAQDANPPADAQPVQVGDTVAEFELAGLDGGKYFPSAHSSPLVLVFFRGAW